MIPAEGRRREGGNKDWFGEHAFHAITENRGREREREKGSPKLPGAETCFKAEKKTEREEEEETLRPSASVGAKTACPRSSARRRAASRSSCPF